MCVYIYIYIYIERERERDTYIHVICIYIYIYTHIFTKVQWDDVTRDCLEIHAGSRGSVVPIVDGGDQARTVIAVTCQWPRDYSNRPGFKVLASTKEMSGSAIRVGIAAPPLPNLSVVQRDTVQPAVAPLDR